MTAVDILTDARFASEMKEEFQAYKSEGFLKVPGLPPHYRPFTEEFTNFQKTKKSGSRQVRKKSFHAVAIKPSRLIKVRSTSAY